MDDRARKIKEAIMGSEVMKDFDNKMQADDAINGFDKQMQADDAMNGFDKQMLDPDKTGGVSADELNRPLNPEELAFQEKQALAQKDAASKMAEAEMRKQKIADLAAKEQAKFDAFSAREAERQAGKIAPKDWRKELGNLYESSLENMNTEKSLSQADIAKLLKRQARIDSLKNLGKSALKAAPKLGWDLAKGAAIGAALDPTELANSEIPGRMEELKQLYAKKKKEESIQKDPYNRQTRFDSVRKKLGLE